MPKCDFLKEIWKSINVFFSSVKPLFYSFFYFWIWEKVGAPLALVGGDFAPRPHLRTTLIICQSNFVTCTCCQGHLYLGPIDIGEIRLKLKCNKTSLPVKPRIGCYGTSIVRGRLAINFIYMYRKKFVGIELTVWKRNYWMDKLHT